MPVATVTVRGEAVVSGQPDEAKLSLLISSLRSTPEDALSEVARSSDELEKILWDLEIPRGSRITSGLSVTAETEYDTRSSRHVHRGYRASNRMELRLDDPKVIGRLMTEATGAGAEIGGPWWQVALDNPARVEAHRHAAADAKRKAEAFVSALGARLGSVAHVQDPRAAHSSHAYGRGDGDYVMSSVALSAPAPEIDVEAGDLDISAAVDVTFHIEPA